MVSGNISGFIYILTILIISSHLALGSHVDINKMKIVTETRKEEEKQMKIVTETRQEEEKQNEDCN